MANTRNDPLEDLAMHIPMICDRYELRDDAVGRCLIYNSARPGQRREMPSKFSGLEVGAGDVMAYDSPNGGGYGDPLKRQAAKVLEDVLDGFCSLQDAREVYGVVIDLDDESLDPEATGALRRKMSA